MKTLTTLLCVAALLAPTELLADAASGQATGKRQHKPLTVIKPIDKSTPATEAKKQVKKPEERRTIGSSTTGAAGAGKAKFD